MRTIGKYGSSFEANVVKGLLESEGIRAEVLHENLPYCLPFGGNLYEVELVVNDEDYDQALKILAASFIAE